MAKEDQIEEYRFDKRTAEEQREIARRGGIASGKARREKATMISVLEKLLDEVPIADNEEGLTNRELATLGLIKGANQGNPKNYEIIQQMMEKKEKKDEARKIKVYLPATAKQIA